MIRGLFETHLFVQDLDRSVKFYGSVLGLEQCYFEQERGAAFFWIGKPRQSMLGLWQRPKEQIDKRHFAFECSAEWILNEAVDFLKMRNIKCWNFLEDGSRDPMVFCWMPAISIYFDDPDGHSLEFIGILPGVSKPGNSVVSYEKWMQLQEGGVQG
jgi:lactoylglutathione lyase